MLSVRMMYRYVFGSANKLMLLRIACSLIRIRHHKVINQRQLPSLKWSAESRMLLGLRMTGYAASCSVQSYQHHSICLLSG